jgi:hypothetical protein
MLNEKNWMKSNKKPLMMKRILIEFEIRKLKKKTEPPNTKLLDIYLVDEEQKPYTALLGSLDRIDIMKE